MTPAERVQLEETVAKYPDPRKRAVRGIFMTWLVFLSGFGVAWFIVVVIGRAAFHARLGPTSPAGLWVAVVGALVCAGLAWSSTARWMRNWKDLRPLLARDLAAGLVAEERLRFTEARRFQEPEHGGLMYFLHTVDDRVFVVFDHESQDLGVDGKDPLASSFHPQEELVLVGAPASGVVLSSVFSGARLETAPPHELALPPDRWPDFDAFCGIPWADLDRTLSGG
jgi:hypothetical protein